ncbi:MAG: 2-C-methyl-D-erythritol 4-phosphate cytidylyltransferase [Candidatus Omnitrophota bacterium]
MLSAIILAAGQGKRLGTKTSKPLVKINSKPLIDYSLRVFNKHPGIDEIIVVLSIHNQAQMLKALKNCSYKKIKSFVLGGTRRQDSVYNGLKAVSPQSHWVLIHDAARPFIDGQSITKVIQAAKKTKAAILGIPVKATIKSACPASLVKKTIDRSNLWEIQTPQVFNKQLINQAYEKYSQENFTDDASLVEKLGKKVKIVLGRSKNIKITTGVDLLFAQLIVKRRFDDAV